MNFRNWTGVTMSKIWTAKTYKPKIAYDGLKGELRLLASLLHVSAANFANMPVIAIYLLIFCVLHVGLLRFKKQA